MLETQVRLGYGVNWFDIQKDGKKWIAFYYDNTVIGSHNVRTELGTTNSDRDNER